MPGPGTVDTRALFEESLLGGGAYRRAGNPIGQAPECGPFQCQPEASAGFKSHTVTTSPQIHVSPPSKHHSAIVENQCGAADKVDPVVNSHVDVLQKLTSDDTITGKQLFSPTPKHPSRFSVLEEAIKLLAMDARKISL